MPLTPFGGRRPARAPGPRTAFGPLRRRRLLASGAASAALTLAALLLPASAAEPSAVLQTYADIAEAAYGDALTTAERLDAAVDRLIAAPSPDTLAAARAAWRAARVPYLQTEAFRFGNPVVDAWEPRVNSWPLDEGLIDYVDPSYGAESEENSLYAADVIANPTLSINGETVDVSTITPDLLRTRLQEAGGIESNVATGYHAIEFLLWGQDLNGTGPGAGARPATDFDPANCTGGHCDRRAAYLRAATDLLVADLKEMAESWKPGGEARQAVLGAGTEAGLAALFTGMGSLSYGELAGERMKLGLLLHDPEEEQDCFSDNTHASHLNDAIGIRNVYLGRYRRVDGSLLEGPSVSDLVKAKDPALDAELRARIDAAVAALEAVAAKAEAGEAYDQQIAEGNAEGNARVQAAIDALIAQTRATERAVAALGLGAVAFEGSESLDGSGSSAAGQVFQ